MSVAEIKRIFISNDLSNALGCPKYTNNYVLVANVPKLVTIPAGSFVGTLASTVDFMAQYMSSTDLANLIANGDFASDTVWVHGDECVIGSGVATIDGSQTEVKTLVQTPTSPIVNGQAYYYTYTITRTAGVITPVIGGTSGVARSAAGTYSEIIFAGSGSTVGFSYDADFAGTVDKVSAIPCAFIPTADKTDGKGVDINPTILYFDDVDKIGLISPSNGIVKISFFASA